MPLKQLQNTTFGNCSQPLYGDAAYVAMTLNNLANLQQDTNEFEAAERGYREALQIRRELAETNPQVFLP
ncbi:MAG: tetratricopeptide repeat protein [Chlorobaculum sp.]|nr:tetratricopeptide repeat protein [Chlorobaculum sp.]